MERKIRTINLTFPLDQFEIIKGEKEATVAELENAIKSWEDFFWHVITTWRMMK